jgi:glutamate 5-kinase
VNLSTYKRIVLKVGSALLVADGKPRLEWLHSLAQDVSSLKAAGHEVVVVTSGAVALGRTHLGRTTGVLRLEEKQAAAAVGQHLLMHAWQQAFGTQAIAQVLLTLEDTEDRRRHLNAQQTLATVLEWGVVPLINENDTIATAEIRFGDNDRLAARVAQMVSADALILLSDIDGLYTADPRTNPDALHLAEVPTITPAIEAMAGKAPVGYSSGGMITKLMAAKIATTAGCAMFIANGRDIHPLQALQDGAKATLFHPSSTPLSARQKWLVSAVQPLGTLYIDAGAANALKMGKSLLPSGITHLDGQFMRGDAVYITHAETPLAVGLSTYDAEDMQKIIKHQSQHIESILGYSGRAEAVHRNDMVLLSSS